tara:strand:+ start:2239 stop:2898 length:660 start_codon:yes stop_codon:yes gene_type:complete
LSKPKAGQYKASPVEKINAAIAMQDKKRFREKFSPVLQEYVKGAFKDEGSLQAVAEGRAQADTMQILTDRPTLKAVQSVDAQADLAAAASAQQLQASAQGLTAARSDQVTGIKMANQMATQTASGLSQASKIATTETLARAKAKQTRTSGLIKAGTILGKQMGSNFQDARALQGALPKAVLQKANVRTGIGAVFGGVMGRGFDSSGLGGGLSNIYNPGG